MPTKPKRKPVPVRRPASIKTEPATFSIGDLVKELNSFSVDNYWDLGTFLVAKVMPVAR
jgi:hypothetical protein